MKLELFCVRSLSFSQREAADDVRRRNRCPILIQSPPPYVGGYDAENLIIFTQKRWLNVSISAMFVARLREYEWNQSCQI
jgi:hypothetical protein